MNLSTNKIAGMIKKNADKIGLLAGLFKDGTDAVFSSFTNIAGVHVPDFSLVFSDVAGDLQTPLMLYLGGMVAEGVNLPFVGNIGKALEKAASGYVGGRIALALLYRSTHAGQGSFEPRSNTQQNFNNAPTVDAYGEY